MGSISAHDWDDLMGTNVKTPLFLSQAAAAALRKSAGLIINLVDIHGSRPLKQFAVYCTAKAALAMLTRALARELAPEVRVNGIAPVPFCGPRTPRCRIESEIHLQTLLQRQGSTDDVSAARLCSWQPTHHTLRARSSRLMEVAALDGRVVRDTSEWVGALIKVPPELCDRQPGARVHQVRCKIGERAQHVGAPPVDPAAAE